MKSTLQRLEVLSNFVIRRLSSLGSVSMLEATLELSLAVVRGLHSPAEVVSRS